MPRRYVLSVPTTRTSGSSTAIRELPIPAAIIGDVVHGSLEIDRERSGEGRMHVDAVGGCRWRCWATSAALTAVAQGGARRARCRVWTATRALARNVGSG